MVHCNIPIVDRPKHKVIKFLFPDDAFAHHKGVAILLDNIEVELSFHQVTCSLDVAPNSLNVQGMIVRKLFMDHSDRVIRPHMAVAILSQM